MVSDIACASPDAPEEIISITLITDVQETKCHDKIGNPQNLPQSRPN